MKTPKIFDKKFDKPNRLHGTAVNKASSKVIIGIFFTLKKI